MGFKKREVIQENEPQKQKAKVNEKGLIIIEQPNKDGIMVEKPSGVMWFKEYNIENLLPKYYDDIAVCVVGDGKTTVYNSASQDYETMKELVKDAKLIKSLPFTDNDAYILNCQFMNLKKLFVKD